MVAAQPQQSRLVAVAQQNKEVVFAQEQGNAAAVGLGNAAAQQGQNTAEPQTEQDVAATPLKVVSKEQHIYIFCRYRAILAFISMAIFTFSKSNFYPVPCIGVYAALPLFLISVLDLTSIRPLCFTNFSLYLLMR